MARTNHDQIFEKQRRISTGSMYNRSNNNNHHHAKKHSSLNLPDQGAGSGGSLTTVQPPSASSAAFNRERIVAWDEEKDFSIDPIVIGSVIESFLKQQEEKENNNASVSAAATSRFLTVEGGSGHQPLHKRGASISLEKQRYVGRHVKDSFCSILNVQVSRSIIF